MKSKLLWVFCLCLAVGLSACNKQQGNNQTSDTGMNNQSSSANPSATTGQSSSATGQSTAGSKMDDAAITAKVKAALMADSDIKSLQINVDTTNGDVKLSGAVDNQTQIDRAVEIARKTDGVANVTNQLTVKQGGQS